MKAGVVNEWLARIAWTSVTIVAGYTATQINGLTTSVSTLNTNVAVIVEQLTTQKNNQSELKQAADVDRRILSEHETRLRILEFKLPNK